MTDENDDNREDGRDGIEKAMDKVAGVFNRITQGASPQKPPGDVEAFFRAVKRNRPDEVKKYIDSGADINVRGPGGDTALHVAARNNNVQIGRLLLDSGADPRAPHGDDPQRSPLADAINFGKAEMAELLTRFGGYAPGQAASNGFTLLHRACEKGNPKLVEAMIGAGADGNEKTGNGATPLLVAIVQRQTAVAEKLLDFPAVAAGINEFFAATDPKRRTAFQLAVEKGQEAVVAKMLRFGSNVNAPDADGETPLHHAILKADLKLIRTLLAHGADLNKPSGALLLACAAPEIANDAERAAIVECLLRHGADPDMRETPSKTTPLHAAVQLANGAETVAALLKYPLAKDPVDANGDTPLFQALRRPDAYVAALLLEAGANPDARHMDDARTPLIEAVKQGSAPAVKLLLAKGANPKLFDAANKSPLSYARGGNFGDIVVLLEEHLSKKEAPRRPPPSQEWEL